MKRQAVLNQQHFLKSRFWFLLVLALVLLAASATLVLARAESTSGEASWSAMSKVDALEKTLQQAGFSLTEGQFMNWDMTQAACEGQAPQAGNNPWPNAYLTLQLPPHPGVKPPLPLEMIWQLGVDEAIVLVGQTPPGVSFFSYQTFTVMVPGIQQRMMVAVGDAINIRTINTIGSDKNNAPIVYIITGNRETERRVRAAALRAGYPASIINVETISPIIAPLGIGEKGSWFVFANRLAVTLDPTAVKDYARNPPYEAYRLTPVEPLAVDPEPVPVLRVRGTGHTEMALYPSLKALRQAILDRYADMTAEELDTKVVQQTALPDNHEIITEKPYVALQRGIDPWGISRDNANVNSYPSFRLRDGLDEFVIVYGANHQTTGKATYASFSLYVY
jgi:hypothetical protein